MLKTPLALTAFGLVVAMNSVGLAADRFPMTIENCGSSVTLKAAPHRIFLIGTNDVPMLAELGALDRVVARTGEPVANLYEPATYEALAKVPFVATEKNATGGSLISLETILAAQPDLVLGAENLVDRQLLSDAGIALYSAPAYCKDASLIPAVASFDLVYNEVETFGKILGLSDVAAARISALKSEVAAIDTTSDHGTGFALYVGGGGKALYPYGARSMVTPVFAAAGLHNVYAQTDERVFEAGTEELLGKNPDVIVLLYSNGTPDSVMADFQKVAGVENFEAVKKGRVVTLPFEYTDPPSPFSVKGAAALAEQLAHLP